MIALYAFGYLLVGGVVVVAVPFFVWLCCMLDDNEPLEQIYREWFEPNDPDDDEVYIPVMALIIWPLFLLIGIPALIYGLIRLLFILIYRKVFK